MAPSGLGAVNIPLLSCPDKLMRVIARGDESVKSCISGRRGTRDIGAVKPPGLRPQGSSQLQVLITNQELSRADKEER